MDTFIGILELFAWCLAVLSLAAAVTYGVIKLSQAWQARRQVAGESQPPQST